MRAVLEAEVEIREVRVFAELAVWEKRPDLQTLCVAARDRRSLDEEAIATVLPGLSLRARENLLRHLSYVGLTDRGGAPTALGRRCATTGAAPAWEQGGYRLLVAFHPLFESWVLDFRRDSGHARDRDFDNLEPLPSGLSPKRDRVFTSAFDGSKRFSIAAFPAERGQNPVCRSHSKSPGKLRWEIDLALGTNEWTIGGHAGDWDRRGKGKFQSPPESMEPNELCGLVADWESQWERAQEGRLAMAYDGKAGRDGRESFLRSRRHDHVEVRRFGTFDKVTVEDVPVGPATKDDAHIWATAILVARCKTDDAYVSPYDWRSGWSSAIKGTPLAEWAGEAPDQTTLSEVNGRPLSARTRWLLAAGADLEMEA